MVPLCGKKHIGQVRLRRTQFSRCRYNLAVRLWKRLGRLCLSRPSAAATAAITLLLLLLLDLRHFWEQSDLVEQLIALARLFFPELVSGFQFVKDDCSGDYERVLLALIK